MAIKGIGAETRKMNQMLKEVQHDTMGLFWVSCHPELVSGFRFWIWNFVSEPRPAGGGCPFGELEFIRNFGWNLGVYWVISSNQLR